MTKRKPHKYDVQSFGPELMAVLIKGSKERVEIPCGNPRQVKFLQYRLHLLRRTMASANHPHAGLVYRARVMTEPNADGTYKIVVQPHDIEFVELFKRAGIDTTLGHDILEEVESPALEAPDDISDPYAKWKGGA